MGKIPWMEELIEDVLPDGTPVKANCWYWAKDVCIEMISPYPGLRTGRHMMYMIPKTFLENDLWRKRALELMEDLVARGRWIDAHPNAVKERRKEGKRRIKIARKYIDELKDERKFWKKKLKKELVDLRTYQQNVNAITKALGPLELIVSDQDEIYWLRDGIVRPRTYPVRLPYPSKHHGFKNVRVYLRDSALSGGGEEGWTQVLETQLPESDLASAGLGEPSEGRSTLDLAAFSAYLKQRTGEKLGSVFDAWREIARSEDIWCATIA